MGNHYKEIREEYEFTNGGYKMTAKKLADIFKEKGYPSLTHEAIRKIESNNRNVSEYELQGYRDVFNTTADYLLGFTNAPSRIEGEISASNITGLNGKAIETLKILKSHPKLLDVTNILLSDKDKAIALLSNINIIISDDTWQPCVSTDVADTTEETMCIPIKPTENLGFCCENYGVLTIDESILKSHATLIIQKILESYKGSDDR